MDLSIVIVNYRAWPHLKACLDSLQYLKQTPQPQAEIIVVDNQSADGQLESFRTAYPGVRWLENDANRGFASGCNLGADSASGACLLFLNPDCIDPDHIIAQVWREAGQQACISTVRQHGADGASRKASGDFAPWWGLAGPGRVALSVLRRRPGSRRKGRRVRVDWVSGSFLMMQAQNFRQLGGWDHQFFMYSEDVDLCRRARAAGLPCQQFNHLQLIHHHGGASRSSARLRAMTRAEVIISHHRFCAKHLRGVQRALGHFQLWLFRSSPALLAAALLPRSPAGQTGQYLKRFYQQVRSTGVWQSPLIADPPVL